MHSLVIAVNLVKRSLRNRRELFGLLVLPVLVIGAIALFIGRATGPTPIGIVNLDQGVFGDRMVQQLKLLPGLKVFSLQKGNYQWQVETGKVELALFIPENFSTTINKGEKTQLEIYAQGDGMAAQKVKQVVNRYISALYQAEELASKLSQTTAEPKQAILDSALNKISNQALSVINLPVPGATFDPGLSSTIGFTVVFIMMLVFSSMGAIMDDKKRLTLARMYVSAIKEWEIIAGNLLGSLFLGLIQLIPLTLLLKRVFHIPWGLALVELFLVLTAFLVAALGLGIGLSGLIKGNFNPTLIGATIIFPTSILGGCFIPDTMMPPFLNTVAWALPQRWVMHAVQQISLGESPESIGVSFGILLMFGLAFSTFGLKTIRPLQEA